MSYPQPPAQPQQYGQPSQQMPYQLVPPMPPRRSKAKGALILGGAVALTALICGAGGMGIGSATSSSAKPAPTVTVTKTVTKTVTSGGTTTTTTAPTRKATSGSRDSFGDGTWIVGKDITAGTYSTTVPQDSIVCTWQRLKNLSGDTDAIIAYDAVSPGGRATVTIKSSDKGFETSQCGTWRKS